MDFLRGLLGCIVVLFIAFLFSDNKKKINYRIVVIGAVLQIVFGYIVLKSSIGRMILDKISAGFSKVLHYGLEGLTFTFGKLVDPSSSVGFVFAFKVAMLAVFFTPLIAVLYRFGIMQFVVRIIGGALSKLLGTSRTESVTAASNIFLGMQEAPIVIKPYVKLLTRSEMFAVMTGGLASVAGGTLASYAALGIPVKFLLAASFMSAPSGLLFAKIMIPETETPVKTGSSEVQEADKEDKNILDVISKGAVDGMKMAVLIIAMLIAFISLMALLNGILGGIGSLFGIHGLSFQKILGYIFAPIAFLIGVPWHQAMTAGNYLGEKIILNEMVAYTSFAPHMHELSSKTVAIVSFALCGFANIGSLGILIGGLTAFAEERRAQITKLGIKAVIAGTLANLMSGAIAGMFLN
ncbi:NupC/NupG family nucleoside CNT transporter [Scopulibacillus cellulosilyticus]|uniref:Nucleoside permease n=1 Tax=Scopulibacillus cellulosilyticus TaxID=2665665 RepID=A0ABW2Q1N6_9BACL